jgi:hypothetical protein
MLKSNSNQTIQNPTLHTSLFYIYTRIREVCSARAARYKRRNQPRQTITSAAGCQSFVGCASRHLTIPCTLHTSFERTQAINQLNN